MPRNFYLSLFCLLCLAASGCAGRAASEESAPAGNDADQAARVEALLAKDPAGPIARPHLPAELEAAAKAAPAPAGSDGEKSLAYTVDCVSLDDPELAEDFAGNSLLQKLIDSPPDSLTKLEQRLAASLEEGRNMLHSRGYYAGAVSGRIELPEAAGDKSGGASAPGESKDRSRKALVHVLFTPGPCYLLGRSSVTVADGAALQGEGLPRSLADAGLPPDSPAEAGRVLDAVDRVVKMFQDKGYPFAAADATRYVVDHGARRLEAEVRVNPGFYAVMGDIRAKGRSGVTDRYLRALRTWKPGEPWNQKKVEDFRDRLRQSGLFRSIDLAPADTVDEQGRRDLSTTLESAPPRTISAEVKYDSDFGPGVQGSWEHRNLTGRGDSLRLSLPVWQEMQELTARYRLPYFLRRDQAFIAQAGVLNQNTDAYDLRSAAAAAGLERQFSPRWTGSAQVSAEGGSVKDPHEPRRDYILLGLPLALAFDNTGSLLNAVKGVRLLASASPYTGTYNNDFNALRARLEAQAFIPLAGQDALVLALRGAYGSLWGATAPDVPPSVRFYSGGGGSVRGYAYQSLGPRDSDDNPLGGSSLLELSAEARWKITQEWGVAAFLDGGMAYDDQVRGFGSNLRWGAGLGLRYYTAIGPLRLDVAAPLTPRSDDAPLQFYISIGQSF